MIFYLTFAINMALVAVMALNLQHSLFYSNCYAGLHEIGKNVQ